MSDKTAYLVMVSENDIRILNEPSEFSALEFNSVEEAENVSIFEIEFKKKVSFNTKVKLNISE